MANWTFYQTYGTQYPALQNSVLNYLVFSDHTIDGNNFTGVLDSAASGVATSTIAWLSGMNSWNFTGTVINDGTTLTVALVLAASDQTQFTSGIASNIPLIGNSITQSASMSINNITTTSETADDTPATDLFAMQVVLNVSDKTLTITSPVPMNGGFFTIQGVFTNFGINLSDLAFLFGGSQDNYAWFPASELGPYYSNSTQLGLLGMSLTVFADIPSKTIRISNATVSIGISNLPIYLDRIYLNPLAVWITMTNPDFPTTSSVSWGIEGSVVVCNYNRTGDPNNPDFSLDCALGLTDFYLTASLNNQQNVTVATMVKDVLGPSADFGIPQNLTVDMLEFETAANMTTGQISDFGFGVGMSGGFGLFDNFDIESFELRFVYTS